MSALKNGVQEIWTLKSVRNVMPELNSKAVLEHLNTKKWCNGNWKAAFMSLNLDHFYAA